MRTYVSEIMEEFSSSTLEGIQVKGKYVIRGFRLGGPSSKMKIQRLKSDLAKKKDVMETVKNYGQELIEKGYLDNTWTFINNLGIETVYEKIKKHGKENVLLELIANDKIDIIKELYHSKEEDAVDVEDSFETEVKLVKNLRAIIRGLEDEKGSNEKEILSLKKSMNKMREDYLLMQNKESLLNKKLEIEKKQRQASESKQKEFKEEKHALEKEVRKIKEENILLNEPKHKVAVYLIGGEKIKGWFNQNNKFDRFDFVYLNLQLDSTEDKKISDEVWLINPHIDRAHMQLIYNNELISEMYSLQRKFNFDDLDEVKRHMKKLEVIN